MLYVDGVIDDELITQANDRYISAYWNYNHGARRGDNTTFFVSQLLQDKTELQDCNLQKEIFSRIKEYFKFTVKESEYDRQNCFLNGQTYELDGAEHTDNGYCDTSEPEKLYTIIYMVNKDDSGLRGFKTPYTTVPYKSGRVVLCQSIMPHAGLSCDVKNKLRMTLVWKGYHLEFDNDSPMVIE